jgi:hypothetical protein
MIALTKWLAGGLSIVALATAAPAAAQYYPGMGYPGYGFPGTGYPGYGTPGYGVPGYGAPGYGGYGNVPGGSQIAANQCTAAVQQRLGGYGGYGYAGGAGGRVLGINSIEIASGGGYRVHGVASPGGYAYGGGTIGFTCRTDPRGFVIHVGFNNGGYGNRYYGGGYGSNYDQPYAQYGYYRY